jgi:phosphatidylserine/phosphatidylglycerophosphate/cardiolipin synthase-like enzyme
MKKFALLSTFCLLIAMYSWAQTPTPINLVRPLPPGTVVTVQGMLTADRATMRWTGYMQDETGGISFYDAASNHQLDSLKPGDIFIITGTLKDYNALLEISPVSSVTLISSNNPLPAPVVVPVDQIDDSYESMLVKLENVHFDASVQGQFFTGGSTGFNYNITDLDGNTTQIRVLPTTNIVGTLIPIGNVNITGCLAQYSPSNPTTGYQLIPRSVNDMVVNSTIKLTEAVSVVDLTPTSINLRWVTDNPGSTLLKYGHTSALELGTLTGTGNVTEHTISIPGSASEMFYAQALSVSNTVATDTAKSAIGAYITASTSTGDMKVYFNTPVDNTVSTGTNAIYLNEAIDDTLINYINRAKHSMDIAIYSFETEHLSDIAAAINAAKARGVNVRVVYDGSTTSSAIALLDASINKISRPEDPTYGGIMHNKFMVIDANYPLDAIVWTGSFNWSSDNMNTDANNAIIIQDQSLAKVYTVEFEEMWGSSTLVPNASNAKWGGDKTDNTPHDLRIAGKRVECFFSPSDNVNNTIINHIRTANSDLEVAVMLLTRREIAYAVSDVADSSVMVSFLVSSKEGCITQTGTPAVDDYRVVNAIVSACQGRFIDYTGGGIMHNKYMIVDQSNTASDPFVWTGSHNWSASADMDNDENSIAIHDATIANIYYQNFAKIITMGDVIYDVNDFKLPANNLKVYPNPANGQFTVSLPETKATTSQVALYDFTGRCVYSTMKHVNASENSFSVSTVNFTPGLYILQVRSGEKIYNQKVLVK